MGAWLSNIQSKIAIHKMKRHYRRESIKAIRCVEKKIREQARMGFYSMILRPQDISELHDMLETTTTTAGVIQYFIDKGYKVDNLSYPSFISISWDNETANKALFSKLDNGGLHIILLFIGFLLGVFIK